MKKAKEEEHFIRQSIDFDEKDFKILVNNRSAFLMPDKAFHEELELKYFYEGRSSLLIDSNIINVEAGDITIANPYEVHSHLNVDLLDCKYYLLILDLDFFIKHDPSGLDLRALLVTRGLKFENLIRGDKRLQAIIVRIAEEMREKKEYYRLIVYGLLSELMALLLRDRIDRTRSSILPQKRQKGAALIAPALSLIFKNYKEHLSVEELAAACRVSKYYFCRTFKREMGMTVVQYITRYRLSIAEVMLTSTGNSIAEIAYECGFGDVNYFNRCYKREKGVSPRKKRT